MVSLCKSISQFYKLKLFRERSGRLGYHEIPAHRSPELTEAQFTHPIGTLESARQMSALSK